MPTTTLTPLDVSPWTVPFNVILLDSVEVFGCAGDGQDSTDSTTGTGGGGWAYARSANLSVTPSGTIAFVVPSHGSNTVADWNSGQVAADYGRNGVDGGDGGSSGSPTTGGTTSGGGSGGVGGAGGGGGGGAGGGPSTGGSNGAAGDATTGGTGGGGDFPGAAGGDLMTDGADAGAGQAGGGGAGLADTAGTQVGGIGGDARIVLTYQTVPAATVTSVAVWSDNAGTVSANRNHHTADGIYVFVTFDRDVALTGEGITAPGIAIDVGGVTKYAYYYSGDGTATIVFAYSVEVGDLDTDGIVVDTEIQLLGATIKNADATAQDAVLTFSSPDTSAVFVNAPPTTPTDSDAGANTVEELVANGTAVGVTAVSTVPGGDTITYALTDDAGGRFTIDTNTGVVTVADGTLLVYANDTSHQITVQATDGDLNASANFTINVTPVGGVAGPFPHYLRRALSGGMLTMG